MNPLIRRLLPLLLGTVILAGPTACTEGLGTAQREKATLSSLLPITGLGDTWYYHDAGGFAYTITVADTISDEGERYAKLLFIEASPESQQSDWFVSREGSVYHSETLRAVRYDLFLPASYPASSGTFDGGSGTVTYTLHDRLDYAGASFGRGVELRYATPQIHGFETVTFAENIGIVSLCDESGRRPVEYVLDSVRIAGVMRRF